VCGKKKKGRKRRKQKSIQMYSNKLQRQAVKEWGKFPKKEEEKSVRKVCLPNHRGKKEGNWGKKGKGGGGK